MDLETLITLVTNRRNHFVRLHDSAYAVGDVEQVDRLEIEINNLAELLTKLESLR
jgi:hypothetical protein